MNPLPNTKEMIFKLTLWEILSMIPSSECLKHFHLDYQVKIEGNTTSSSTHNFTCEHCGRTFLF